MNCREFRKLFALYYDSEGDAEVQLRIGDHLAACKSCRQWFARESRQVAALEAMLRGDAAPDGEMWRRIKASISLPATGPRALASMWPLGAVALVVVAAVLFWSMTRHGAEEDAHLSAEAAAYHDEYVRGIGQPSLASESVEEIEGWLRANVGFQVRCPPAGQAEFHLVGADVRHFGLRRAAHIVGAVHGRPVSIFVIPPDALDGHLRSHLKAEGDQHACREGRYEMVACVRHGHVVMALGEDSRQVLTEVLLGYGSHHAALALPNVGHLL